MIRKEIVQLSTICPKCQLSYWTIDGKCNGCGDDRSKEIKMARQSYKKFNRLGKK